MLVPEFCQNGGASLPQEFLDSLPKYCPAEDCGFPMEMSETLTQLHCSNPRCPDKIVQRLVAIAKDLGVKDLGEAKAAKFVSKYRIINPLDIFAFDPDVNGELGDGISFDVTKHIIDQFNEKKSFTLTEYIRRANLPYIQTSAVAIFDGYDDIVDAYKDIEFGGVEFIRDKLSIKKGSSEDDIEESISIRALKVFDSLMTYKTDLIEAVNYVNIIKTNVEGMINLKAVCSDEVGVPFKTKADFYATVNNKYPNVHVEFLNAVTKKIDYLVWAGANGSPARHTNKVKKVEGYNTKFREAEASGSVKSGEHFIPIVTAQQFLNILNTKSRG